MPHTYVNTTLPEELRKEVDELRGKESRYKFCRRCIKLGVEVLKNERNPKVERHTERENRQPTENDRKIDRETNKAGISKGIINDIDA